MTALPASNVKIEQDFQERYDCLWIIPVQTHQQLAYQTLEFGTRNVSELQWVAKVRRTRSGTLAVKFKLLEEVNLNQISPTGATITYFEAGVSGKPELTKKFDSITEVEAGQEIEFDLGWYINSRPPVWAGYCDNGKPLNLKLKLISSVNRVFLPITAEQVRASSTNSCPSKQLVSLQENFAGMYNDKKFADLKIVCSDGIELAAHRAVLSARNPVFEAMLQTDMSEKNTGVVRVDDVSGNTMNMLLNYFYSGKILPEWSKPEVIHEFVYAIGKYQIKELLQMIDENLGSTDVSTYDMKLLRLVNGLQLKKADARIARKLGERFSEVLNGDELLELVGGGKRVCK